MRQVIEQSNRRSRFRTRLKALEGRLTAVADVYDALTRDRVYRARYSHAEAFEMLEHGRGTHFDPEVLDALLAPSRTGCQFD